MEPNRMVPSDAAFARNKKTGLRSLAREVSRRTESDMARLPDMITFVFLSPTVSKSSPEHLANLNSNN